MLNMKIFSDATFSVYDTLSYNHYYGYIANYYKYYYILVPLCKSRKTVMVSCLHKVIEYTMDQGSMVLHEQRKVFITGQAKLKPEQLFNLICGWPITSPLLISLFYQL